MVRSFPVSPFRRQFKCSSYCLFIFEKNQFFFQSNKHEIYCGGFLCLTRSIQEGVSERDLKHLLNFLEVPGLTQKTLISSCLKLNSYNPLILYMQNMKDSLSKI